jgi:DNA helicase-2/ATP-dependent DNA helicase PcrA
VHRVKGQEWPVVVVHQADADQFPHRLADDLEEERRVFHVAITRASRDLHIVPDSDPSPFIDELTTEPSARAVPERRAPEPARRDARPGGKPGHGLTADQNKLFEELRSLRRHLAAGKPAYTVFADTVLHDIAVARPASLAELSRVKGVGPSKLEQYGAAVLAVVEESAGG